MTGPEEFDVVVLGAGAAGMTAALVSAIEGMRTLVVERAARVGGTTARSSGTVWIPDNPHQRAKGIDDSKAVRTYLDALVGARGDATIREAFLAAGPEMVAYLEHRAGIAFRPYWQHPDYRQEIAGAALGGRPLEPLPFDGRTLGGEFDRVAWPLPELMLFGGMMVTRAEATRLLRPSWDGLRLAAALVTRFAADRVRYRRGTRLVLGNALAARLYAALLERNVTVRLETRTLQLVCGAQGIERIVVERGGNTMQIHVRRAVMLAGGGFPASRVLRERHLPVPTAEHTPAAEGCTGETIELAQQAGASLGPAGEDNALWFPSSIAARSDGSIAVYPHIVLDRAKPGFIAVDSAGRRFVDEAVSYHEFTRAMYRSHRATPCIPAWLVCDRRGLWRYGIGMVRPKTPFLRSFIDSGYLRSADSLDALARVIGVDAAGLEWSVRRHNAFARAGVDGDFGKGGNAYDRANGDPAHTPNPCLGPLDRPPFYAVALLPTPLGTSLGLRTNAHAQVCRADGSAISGLYACGNDMHSPMGGEYPGAGAQLGPGMTFGYVAARHAAQGRG